MYFKKRTYYSFESVEEVENRIKDFSKGFFNEPNLWSRKMDENSFIITQKYSVAFFRGSPAKIEATIVQEDDRTKIQTIIRASYEVFIIQLFFCGLFIFGCLNISSDPDASLMYIFISLVFMIIIHLFHIVAIKRIQRIFEYSMDLI